MQNKEMLYIEKSDRGGNNGTNYEVNREANRRTNNGMNSENSSGENWGGKRANAGRKKTSSLPSHEERPLLSTRKSFIVQLRVRSGHASLKQAKFLKGFWRACLRSKRFGLRILNFQIQDKKIILLCETNNNKTLESGFKSLNTILALHLKKIFLKRHKKIHSGPVFLCRFEICVLKNLRDTLTAIQQYFSRSNSYYEANDILRYKNHPLKHFCIESLSSPRWDMGKALLRYFENTS